MQAGVCAVFLRTNPNRHPRVIVEALTLNGKPQNRNPKRKWEEGNEREGTTKKEKNHRNFLSGIEIEVSVLDLGSGFVSSVFEILSAF